MSKLRATNVHLSTRIKSPQMLCKVLDRKGPLITDKHTVLDCIPCVMFHNPSRTDNHMNERTLPNLLSPCYMVNTYSLLDIHATRRCTFLIQILPRRNGPSPLKNDLQLRKRTSDIQYIPQ